MTKLAFVVVALVASVVGVSQAQAGAGSYMLGGAQFADRCEASGGNVYGDLGCDLGHVQIDCIFEGAQTYCEWEGAQNVRGVSRVLGVAMAESLSEPVQGKKKKPKHIGNFFK
jgi:hypothetical protein